VPKLWVHQQKYSPKKSPCYHVYRGDCVLSTEDPYIETRVNMITGFLPCLSATIPHTVEEIALPNIYEAPSLIAKAP